MSAKRLRANALLLLASAIWGFAFVAQRVGAESIDAFTFNAVRFAMGAAALVPVVLWLDRRRRVPKPVRVQTTRAVIVPGLITGTLLAVAVGMQQLAMSHTTAGNAAFITGLYMVFVPIVAAFRGQRSNWTTVAGIALSLVGLYFLAVGEGFRIGFGDGIVLASTFVWTAQILVIEHYSKRLSALRFSISQFAWCAAISAIAALFLDAHPFAGLGEGLIPLLYGGLLSVGVAYTLQVVAQRDALASHAALIMSSESVFGAIGGALLLAENMGLRGYFGAVLMAAGIAATQWRMESIHPPPVAERKTQRSLT